MHSCYPNGLSIAMLCLEKNFGPSSAMYKQSSNRIPNSPGIEIVGSSLKHIPTAIFV